MDIQERLQNEAENLQDAIRTRDLRRIRESISYLISKRAIVKVQITSIEEQCCAHFVYFPDQMNRFDSSSLILPACGNPYHKICLECFKLYVKALFPDNVLENTYTCPGCSRENNYQGLLFTNENLENFLRFVMGDDYINMVKYPPSTIGQISTFVVSSQNTSCGSCQSPGQCTSICAKDHRICFHCLSSWANMLNSPTAMVKCPFNECAEALNIKNFITSLGKTNLIFPIRGKFFQLGINLNFCHKCKAVIVLDTNSEVTTCSCNAKICSFCGGNDHFGFTCFYLCSSKEFDKIVLAPPANPDHPASILEWEYIRARYAFNHFVNQASNLEMSKATLVVNKKLEERYKIKKLQMEKECGSRAGINECYIWHGSAEANYNPIMQDGLLVGGVDKVPGGNAILPIGQGKAYGYGVYSATTPNTPIGYAKGGKSIMCCLAMKGNNSTATINDPSQLTNGKTHSHACNTDWVIFFTKEQILPRYLIEFKTKGT